MDVLVSKKRWLIISIMFFANMTNSIQWLQYSIVPEIYTEFYQKSYNAISATSLLGSLSMIIMIIPVTFLVELKSTRFVLLLGTVFSFTGAFVKCFAVSPDRYWVLMFGQALAEINVPIVLAIPPKIAANWFPNHELAQAVAISVFGDQLGIALSYLVPFVIKGPVNSLGIDYENNWSNTSEYGENATLAIDEVSKQIYAVSIFTASISFLSLLFVFFMFKDKPKVKIFSSTLQNKNFDVIAYA